MRCLPEPKHLGSRGDGLRGSCDSPASHGAPSGRGGRQVMTCICADCDRIIGEACPYCGTEAVPLKTNPKGIALLGTFFDCPNCGNYFGQGRGGELHTRCGGCSWLA